MLHQAGASSPTVRAELRALVQSVRPSLLAAVGIDAAPFDLLTGDGILGWRLGLQSLSSSVPPVDPRAPCSETLSYWLDRELDKEQFRWGNALTVVRALDSALAVTPLTHDDRRFVRTWSSNLRWTERRCRHGQCGLAGDISRPAARIRQALSEVPDAGEIIDPLESISATPRGSLPHPWHHSAIIEDEDIDLLRGWLA